MSKLIGLGLRPCIQDILEQKVSLDEVKEVLTGSSITDGHWEGVEADVCRGIPEGVTIFRSLLESGRVRQPAIENGNWNLTSRGHWTDTSGQPVDLHPKH